MVILDDVGNRYGFGKVMAWPVQLFVTSSKYMTFRDQFKCPEL